MKALITDRRHASIEEEQRVFDAAGIDLDTTYCENEDALIANGRGAVGFLVSYARVSRRVMEALPELKVVVKYGIGVDTIDVEAATALGKYVANVPDYCTEEVASHALALILSGLRAIPEFSELVRQRSWAASPEGVIRYRPSTVKLGLVGYGRISRKLAEYAAPLFKETLFFDPFIEGSGEPEVRKVETIEALFEECRIVSVHAPLTPTTRGLVSAEAVSKGSGVILVNTSRGPVVAEEAVRAGLSKGWLSFFGADVYWQEPPDMDSEAVKEMLADPRVCITPHVGWCSDESAHEVRRKAAEEVVRVARGGLPLNLVNKGVLPSR